jgi:broad specificity phosphatase PhoE
MRMVKLVLALLGALAGSTLAASPALAQERYVMRHLNTPQGEQDPDLLPEGKATADRLVQWFQGKPLTAIYVTEFKRSRQTAAPIAAQRGLTVKVYDPANTPALIALVKAEPGAVLVVGHSNTVPVIVEQLGGEKPAPLTHHDFGDLWTVAGGKTVREKLAH